MLKKLFLILCFCLISNFANSQSKYVIHRIGGSVELVSAGQKPTKGFLLGDNDKIKIGDQSYISIIDKANHKLFEYRKVGTYSVSEIVSFCKNENNSITSGFVREIRNNIAKGDGKNSRSVGAVRRGEIDEMIMEQIYAFISKHINDTIPSSTEVTIQLSREDDCVSMTLVNNTEEILFANVLELSNGIKPTFCFESDNNNPCLILMPHSDLDMNHIKMLDVGQKFLLVCSDMEFDSEGIQFMIDEQLEPNDTINKGCQCYSFVVNASVGNGR